MRHTLFDNEMWFLTSTRRGFGRAELGLNAVIARPLEAVTVEDGIARWRHYREGEQCAPLAELPFWSRLGSRNHSASFIEFEEAAGWPFASMWRAVIQIEKAGHRSTEISQPSSGLHFWWWEETSGNKTYSERALPLVPIWLGFLADTLIFSTGWGGAMLLIGRSILRRRLKRSLCPRCRYDLSGTGGIVGGCPECGWNRCDRAASARL